MKKEDIRKKYDEQKKLLDKYNHHYFNLDAPLITDSKYDKIKKEIVAIEKNYPFLVKKNLFKIKLVHQLQKNLKKLNILYLCCHFLIHLTLLAWMILLAKFRTI